MNTVILAAILVALAIIALELYLILVHLARFPGLLKAPEAKGESPTINVNVGTGQAFEQKTEAKPGPEPEPAPAPAKIAEAPIPAPPPEPEPEPEPEPPPLKPRFAGSAAATASGLIALRCPSCQAENSSYRSECFNCGASLS